MLEVAKAMDYVKVLLVEDNALLSIVGEKLINKLGFKVVGKAASGEEVLDKINEFNPDILVMDIQLSGKLDGIQTVEQLRSTRNNIPVIFLSGNSEKDLKDRAEEVDCVEYLVKPICADMLKNPLEKASGIAKSHAIHAA